MKIIFLQRTVEGKPIGKKCRTKVEQQDWRISNLLDQWREKYHIPKENGVFAFLGDETLDENRLLNSFEENSTFFIQEFEVNISK